jgi:hypothetical protein
MQVWHDLKSGQLDLRGHEDKIARLVALVAQAEYGDQTSNLYQRQSYANLLTALGDSANVASDADIDAVAQVNSYSALVVTKVILEI